MSARRDDDNDDDNDLQLKRHQRQHPTPTRTQQHCSSEAPRHSTLRGEVMAIVIYEHCSVHKRKRKRN